MSTHTTQVMPPTTIYLSLDLEFTNMAGKQIISAMPTNIWQNLPSVLKEKRQTISADKTI